MGFLLRGSTEARRHQALERNMSTKGPSLILHLNLAMLVAMLMCMYCILADLWTEANCESEPMDVKPWLRGMAVLQGFSCFLFFGRHWGLAEILGRQAEEIRGEVARRAAVAPVEPERPPLPGLSPAPQALPAEEPYVPLRYSLCCDSPLSLLLTSSLLVLWCLLGFFVAVDVRRQEAAGECDSGCLFVWCITVISLIQTGFCHLSSQAAEYRSSRPSPEPVVAQESAEDTSPEQVVTLEEATPEHVGVLEHAADAQA